MNFTLLIHKIFSKSTREKHIVFLTNKGLISLLIKSLVIILISINSSIADSDEFKFTDDTETYLEKIQVDSRLITNFKWCGNTALVYNVDLRNWDSPDKDAGLDFVLKDFKTGQIRILNKKEGASEYNCSSDGKWIFYRKSKNDPSVWRYNIDTGKEVLFKDLNSVPIPSPDGTKLLIDSSPNNKYSKMVVRKMDENPYWDLFYLPEGYLFQTWFLDSESVLAITYKPAGKVPSGSLVQLILENLKFKFIKFPEDKLFIRKSAKRDTSSQKIKISDAKSYCNPQIDDLNRIYILQYQYNRPPQKNIFSIFRYELNHDQWQWEKIVELPPLSGLFYTITRHGNYVIYSPAKDVDKHPSSLRMIKINTNKDFRVLKNAILISSPSAGADNLSPDGKWYAYGHKGLFVVKLNLIKE